MKETLLVFLFGMFWAGYSVAQEKLQQPVLRPGMVHSYEYIDLWKNEVTRTTGETVLSVDGKQASLEVVESRAGGNFMRRDRLDLLHLTMVRPRRSGPHQAIRFPIAIGDTWRWGFSVPYGQNSTVILTWDLSAKFVGWEDVTVPAGTFRSAKIEHIGHWRTSDGGEDRLIIEYWYAPDVGRFIKGREIHYRWRKIDIQEEFRLTKFQPAQEDAGRLQWKEKLEAAIKAKDWELLDKLTEEYALEIEREKQKK